MCRVGGKVEEDGTRRSRIIFSPLLPTPIFLLVKVEICNKNFPALRTHVQSKLLHHYFNEIYIFVFTGRRNALSLQMDFKKQ